MQKVSKPASEDPFIADAAKISKHKKRETLDKAFHARSGVAAVCCLCCAGSLV